MFEIKLPKVWEVNKPYPEVIQGTLTEDVFAASLSKVRAEKSELIYQDPNEFFEKTHVTDALSTLIQQVLEKLNGSHPEHNSVYKLETSFGGGKTHCLISLFHAFSGRKIESDTFKEIVGSRAIPSGVKIACLDGEEYNPEAGDVRDDGVIVQTLWGDLAYQLGGKEAYDSIKMNDKSRVSPGANSLEKIMGNDPILILIDEPAAYFSRAASVVVGGTTLSKQTVTFLFDLLSAVSKKPNAVVVLTLASSVDAFNEFTAEVNSAISQSESVVSRKAQIVYPTKESEIYGVVRRRLFKSWDEESGKKVVKNYFQMYSECDELNNKFKTKDYLKKMEISYPFHPELIDILENRVSSISTFQKTRGALRLLARVVADMWEKKEEDAHLIQPAFVDLDNQYVRNELTGKIQKGDLIPAIQADIANENGDAKAQLWNADYLSKKLPPIVTRVSNAIYLYSLIIAQDKKGMDGYTLLGSVLTPGIQASTFLTLLKKMDEEFWYYEESNGRCFFKSEPTINKIIQDYMAIVESSKIRARLTSKIEQLFRGPIFSIKSLPSGPSEVKDDENLKLIIIDYETTYVDSKDDKVPNIVNQIWNYSKDNAPRVNKNTTFFMVGDKNQIARMREIAKEFEAYQLMETKKEDLANLSKEQRNKLEIRKKNIEQNLIIAIFNVYRFLYYPKANLEVAELDPGAIGEASRSRQEIIKDLLGAEGKIKDKIKAAYTKSKAWPTHQVEVSTQVVANWFLQKFNLPIPAKTETIKKMVKDGVKEKIWVYLSDSKIYLKDDSISSVKISNDAKLIIFNEAVKRNLCNKDGERCQECKKWPCECVAEPTEPKPGPGPKPGTRIKPVPKPRVQRYSYNTGKGLPEIIIRKLENDLEEKKPDTISELKLTTKTTTGAQSFITLIVHLPPANKIIVDFEGNKSSETVSTITQAKFDFAGSPQDFREFFNGIKSFIDNKKLSQSVSMTMSFNDEKISILDKFFSNLKAYNTIEYDMSVIGKISPN